MTEHTRIRIIAGLTEIRWETRRRRIIAALVVALIAAGLCALSYAESFRPRPVLTDPEAVVRTSVSVRIYTGRRAEAEELEDFDEQAVLDFLTTLQKQRVNRNVHQLSDPTVCIGYFDGSLDFVYLCESDRDCVYSSTGDRYMSVIPDSDRAFAEIREILNIDA